MSNLNPNKTQTDIIVKSLDDRALIRDGANVSISITSAGLWTARIDYADKSFNIITGFMEQSTAQASINHIQGPFKLGAGARAVGSFSDTQEKARKVVEEYRASVKQEIKEDYDEDSIVERMMEEREP